MIRLFSVEALRTGWSLWWRSWLILLVVLVIPLIVTVVAEPMIGRAPFLLLVLGIIGNLGLIVLLNRAGKVVARKCYQTEIRQFIGWSLWWRMMLMVLLLAIPSTLVLALFFDLLKPNLILSPHQELVFNVASSTFGALIRLALVMMACGWAFGRVLKRVGKSEGLETQKIVE